MTQPDAQSGEQTPFAAPVPGRARRRLAVLAGLSREHHHALTQTIHLKRAGRETAWSVRPSSLECWGRDGTSRVVEEETVRFSAYARFVEERVLFPLIADATGMTVE